MRAIQKAIEDTLGRTNLLLIAAAVAIGYATLIVAEAIVDSVAMPIIAAIVGDSSFEFESESLAVWGVELKYGILISAFLTFALVLTAVYFLFVAHERGATAASTRPCPECTSSIPAAAKRCPRCTAVVEPRSS